MIDTFKMVGDEQGDAGHQKAIPTIKYYFFLFGLLVHIPSGLDGDRVQLREFYPLLQTLPL